MTARESRAPGLRRDRIIDEALAVVAGEGLHALTMRRLARRLGVAPMSLYRHVQSKAELLALVVERIAEGLPQVDAGGPWDETVRAVLRAIRRLLVQHPGIGPAVTNQALFTPSALTAVEGLLHALHRAGLDEARAARAFVVLWTYTLGGVMAEQSMVAGTEGSAAVSLQEQRERIVAALRHLATDQPRVAAATTHWLDFESDDAFEAGLDLLLAGIAATLPPRGQARTGEGGATHA